MSNNKVFSKIDLKRAYWQFPMQEQSIEEIPLVQDMGSGNLL